MSHNSKIVNFDTYIKQKLKNCWNIPGLMCAIFDSKKIIYKYKYGFSDLEKKSKLSFEDKFCIASCSKSILCIAIEIMISKKLIPNIWDFPINKFYPKCNKKFINIPVWTLACHTSGVDDFLDCPKLRNKLLQKIENNNAVKSRQNLAHILLKLSPKYEPNTKFNYSNWGYGILCAIIEKITRLEYSEIINKFIFEPLSITGNFHKYYKGNGYVSGHEFILNNKLGKYKSITYKDYPDPKSEEAAGEIYITLNDSVKYCQLFMKNENILISNKHITNLITPRFGNYAFGWKIDNNSLVHAGEYFHMKTQYMMFPKNNIGLIVECNTSNFHPSEICQKFIELFL